MPIEITDLPNMIGQELATSDWLEIDGSRLDDFHKATYLTRADVDLDYNRNSPMGDDVADGFYLLALLSHFHLKSKFYRIQQGAYALNYGLERVRFLTPVRVGQRVRCRVRLLDASEKRPGCFVAKTENTLEIEGSKRPAMVAEWLNMIVEGGAESRSP